ncbi:MAG TPA: Do family serine endopeptidase [Gemmatimonadaceae bacterium]|nr:Do family serine endopeptidase [Gemmatimonadaceae bacterium]
MTKLARAQLVAVALIAFASGLVFASGFDFTKISWAQSRTAPAAKPTPQEVKPLEETGQAFEAIADHVTPAVVSIRSEQLEARRQQRRNIPPGMEDFFKQFELPDQQQPRTGTGSGFIVSKDGYILTNNHVVEDADRVTVTLLDNRQFTAKVVGTDPTTDVALIKVDASDLPTVTLGDDEQSRVGQWVVAIGNPLGLDFTVTAGIISAKGRSQLNLPNSQRYSIQDFIQTDAAINPGNSGGPLVNIHGEVIGINSAIASATGYNAGYGFAIPITLAKVVMEDIKAYGRVRRAVLGVSIAEVEPADARAAGLTEIRGAKVQSFDPNADDSPARRAGLEVGDIIITAAGHRVNRVAELQRVIRNYKPGDVVDVEVMRFGEKKTFKVRLGEPPKATQDVASADDSEPSTARAQPAAADTRALDRLGITVQGVPAQIAQDSRVTDEARRGLFVSAVSSRGPAYRELFANQDIILRVLHPMRRDIRTAADLDQVLRSLKAGDVLSLVVYTLGAQSTRVVTLTVN